MRILHPVLHPPQSVDYADYGGAPKYIMFLPTSALLADIEAGEHPS